MPRRVDNVVSWPARAVPGERNIPRHLKLGILARGRITVPTPTVAPIVAAAQRRGARWPDRLARPLGDLYAHLPLVVELFSVERAGMTADEIDETIVAYLAGRRAAAYQHCAFLEWTRTIVRGLGDRQAMEAELQLDLTVLFAKPKVTLPARPATTRYVLLAYLCVPAAIGRHLRADPTFTGPLLPSPVFAIPTHLDRLPAMPRLAARADPRDELNLRVGPSVADPSLGVLAGHEAAVEIIDKQMGVDGAGNPLLWYRIETVEPLSVTERPISQGPSPRTLLPAGTTMWASSGAVKISAAPWELFRRDLRAWEATLPLLMPVGERITLLRQRSHERRLIFDDVIGTAPGQVYIDDLRDVPGRWGMFSDYEAVIAPDGRWVDLQHLLVGLDVLARPERRVTVTRAAVSFDIGTNWRAATWAGDLGSAVADSQTEGMGAWASYANPTTAADRMNFFLHNQAPEWDLVGDLDPWGILPILAERDDVKSVDDLLALYYEDVVQPVFDLGTPTSAPCPFVVEPLVRRRADALERFLRHEGFDFPVEGASSSPIGVFQDRVSSLRQQRAAARARHAVHLFAEVWRAYRGPISYALTPADAALQAHESQATEYFLDWLATEAMVHCADTARAPELVAPTP